MAASIWRGIRPTSVTAKADWDQAKTYEQRHTMTNTSPLPRVRRVFVRDLEVVASVGVYQIEHRYEQRIFVSVELMVADTYDGRSEKLSEVLDYGALVESLERLIQSGHFQLIETLAERIADLALADTRVLSTKVRIEKPDIIPACRSVGIEIERKRA
jgi:dihydroneopterin aldolase